MAAVVRMFSFTGLMTAPVAAGSDRFSSDSVGLLKYPYAAREAITATDASAQASAVDLTPAGVQVLLVQVQAGKAVHIEINTPGRIVVADTSSPIITGDVLFKVASGWSVSLLEHEVV